MFNNIRVQRMFKASKLLKINISRMQIDQNYVLRHSGTG